MSALRHNLSTVRSLTARVRFLPLLYALVAILAAVPAAQAAANPVISDCSQHNQLAGHYTVAQLRGALSALPADVREYTDCYDVIDRQLLVQLGKLPGSGSGSGGGGSFLPAWLIALLAVIVLGGAGYAGLMLRRRGGGPADEAE